LFDYFFFLLCLSCFYLDVHTKMMPTYFTDNLFLNLLILCLLDFTLHCIGASLILCPVISHDAGISAGALSAFFPTGSLRFCGLHNVEVL